MKGGHAIQPARLIESTFILIEDESETEPLGPLIERLP
jgi:hypothetical protein